MIFVFIINILSKIAIFGWHWIYKEKINYVGMGNAYHSWDHFKEGLVYIIYKFVPDKITKCYDTVKTNRIKAQSHFRPSRATQCFMGVVGGLVKFDLLLTMIHLPPVSNRFVGFIYLFHCRISVGQNQYLHLTFVQSWLQYLMISYRHYNLPWKRITDWYGRSLLNLRHPLTIE